MALHKHEPVTSRQMRTSSPWGDTICQELRDIYHLTKDPVIKLKCRIATAMAKGMAKKLSEYKKGWEKEFYK